MSRFLYDIFLFLYWFTARIISPFDPKAKKWVEYVELVSSDEDLEGWRVIRYDPAPVLKKTNIPLLALFGELDVLVPPNENVDKMQSYLSEAGNGDFVIHVIPGVGHNMETFGTLKGGEWKWPENYWIWSRKSPQFYQTILEKFFRKPAEIFGPF